MTDIAKLKALVASIKELNDTELNWVYNSIRLQKKLRLDSKRWKELEEGE